MNLSDLIHATSQPYSALQRKVDFRNWLFFSRSLAFNMQAQTQSNWCWAATARSVSHYYWFLSQWSQCNIACAELSLTTCCDAPVPDACNICTYPPPTRTAGAATGNCTAIWLRVSAS